MYQQKGISATDGIGKTDVLRGFIRAGNSVFHTAREEDPDI